MDRAADASARMTAAVVPHTGDARERVLRQMFYHAGRWLYLLDAAQDVPEDMKTGAYNPLVQRYALKTPDITGRAPTYARPSTFWMRSAMRRSSAISFFLVCRP